ncbi:class I SAM-dependent RNA methyltransferase [Haliea sp. E1-2-M8]|uniref:class I SAM-dependent RNA methyltransferase n=1 Tax=Haliea sp. E1-2-M8 TaxID=3064706 RepID=UPI00271F140F|nr:class I SAM-dependent RNA methyltransferase [Haliea sp. E1-2-M8]MDO8863453.1 class I SAM-dependent RNA methyltransferase [Haliea sp. E1-2-M8]
MPELHEQFTATVRDLGTDGSGIVEHPGGQVFFVAGVWPGETARFAVTGFKQRFGFARLLELLEPSPARVTPPCVHHGTGPGDCGGCPWQFVNYAAQLEAKEQRVQRALARLQLTTEIAPIWGSPAIFGYRNRAQFKTDGRKLGYVAAGSRQLAPIADCPILTQPNRGTLQALLQSLPNNLFRPGRKQDWTTLDVDEEVSAAEVVPNQRRPFRQGNAAQNLRMREWLGARVDQLDPSRTALELFSGSGNFTEMLVAAGFARILAVEGVEDSVQALAARQLPGVEAQRYNLFAEADCSRLQEQARDASILVLDPPRDGFKLAGLLLTKKHRLRDVFYISCDPATFARDIDIFIGAGFRTAEIQPLDLFPHTPHVELLCWLQRPAASQ